jgi:hypothetical protein
MKHIKVFSSLVLLVLAIFILSCKEAPKTEGEKDKTKVTDTTKKSVVNTDELVAKIQKYRTEGEEKLNKKSLTKKEITLKGDNIKENIKQKWEKMDAYFDGDKVIRLQLYPHKGISERTEEFYVKDGMLVFAFIQDIGPKHEGKDAGEPGKEFYFDNDKLIKMVNTTKEEVKNTEEEKKMYESKLPYEIKELLEIVKTAK